LIDQFNTPRRALQVDEATSVDVDALLITYVWYVLENDVKEDCFCFANLLMVELYHCKRSI
jgi:hypothetical protein